MDSQDLRERIVAVRALRHYGEAARGAVDSLRQAVNAPGFEEDQSWFGEAAPITLATIAPELADEALAASERRRNGTQRLVVQFDPAYLRIQGRNRACCPQS